MLQTDPGCETGPRTGLRFWNFALHLSFKTIFKELDSDFSDAIKLMWLKKVYSFIML